ncbi:MAG: FAD-binding oxidoreductase [Elusimicrobia bacterium]|nr:FAD-binding oxidoreductase [Elusimicrobiota bacterium]
MMKWWGWGDPKRAFPLANKPLLWPWVEKKLGLEPGHPLTPPVERSSIRLREPRIHETFARAVRAKLGADGVADDEDTRLLHSYGKSYPDLLRVRQGEVPFPPDWVVFPKSHADVESLVSLAHAHGVHLIPFGGGTNIVGGVNPGESDRMIVTVSLARMNRLLELDEKSQMATLQAGATGPRLERDLQARGWSLGHHPDSFEYSTLGGWLATRSAGMQSDAYGKIEDMVVALKLVTPQGTLATRCAPASSAGPDLNRLACGSEGVLGIITEATMRVHPNPQARDYTGFLFRSFEDGVAAIHDCVTAGAPPSLFRLQDPLETELAFHMKAPKRGLEGFIQGQVKRWLKLRGYTHPCIAIVGFEGLRKNVRRVKRDVLAIFKKRKGFHLGGQVGATWSEDKYNIPYLRDLVMDHGCFADVAETATVWANVVPLYKATIHALQERFKEEGISGYMGCHLSHTYKTGACLYFTFAGKVEPGRELERYYAFKTLVTETFLRCGATLTHHHAIGVEHRAWLEREVSPTGVAALRSLKSGLDPRGVLNPGKLLPEPLDEIVPPHARAALR